MVKRTETIYRHTLVVRITHWINVLAVSLLLMSGLNIFMAHPHLYWGAYGADADKPWLEIVADYPNPDTPVGVTRIAGASFRTDGVLGASKNLEGTKVERAFPTWATLPGARDLTDARHWHFLLAWLLVVNGALYLLAGLLNGHFRRDLAPTRAQLRPAHILRNIWDHARLKHPVGEEAKRYNILQKFAYIAVIFVFLPTMVLTGLCMSPGFDAWAPWLVDFFGGRQSARSIHFISADLLVLFVIVHVVEVFIAGVFNEIGSMITGRYKVPLENH